MSVERLWHIAKEHNVLPLANIVLTDPRFSLWSGSSKTHQHHYGDGGLAQHTFEVVDLCLKTNDYFEKLRGRCISNKIAFGTLFHDCGKMWDHEEGGREVPVADGEGNKHRQRIYHLPRSAGLVWNHMPYQKRPEINFTDRKMMFFMLSFPIMVNVNGAFYLSLEQNWLGYYIFVIVLVQE